MPKRDDAQLGRGISQGSPAAVLCAFYVCALRSVAVKLKSDESCIVTHKKLENVKKILVFLTPVFLNWSKMS